MNLTRIKLSEREAQSLISDPEVNPEESLRNMVLKILQKVEKPLHIRDLEYVIVSKGYYPAHNKKIPPVPYRSLASTIHADQEIYKYSDRTYGLHCWPIVGCGVVSNEEVDITVQPIKQDSNNMNNSLEESNNIEKNCPKCNIVTDIELHFCSYCGSDLFKFCRSCLGEIERADAIFCAHCGIKLEQRIKKITCM